MAVSFPCKIAPMATVDRLRRVRLLYHFTDSRNLPQRFDDLIIAHSSE
jgi:hypothetical protein